MIMSATRKNVSSPRMSSVCMENYRSGKQLEQELDRLERERRTRLRELNQESKHFVDLKRRGSSARSRDNSPSTGICLPPLSPGREIYERPNDRSVSPSLSPRSPSDSPPKSRSPSPRPPFFKDSLSAEGSLQQRSPSSSPESQRRLLSRRKSPSNSMSRSFSVTETTVTALPVRQKHNKRRSYCVSMTDGALRNSIGHPEAGNASIPQIFVNDVAPKSPAEMTKAARRTSFDFNTNKRKDPEKTDGPLKVPIRPLRRNSVPHNFTPPAYLSKIAKKESTFVTDISEADRNFFRKGTTHRPRSSSICVPYFNHLKDAPRRNSLIRKYLAKPGYYKRTAATLERLIADLAKGVHHMELLNGSMNSPGISAAEWEKLKECRYLRMPSKDEDIRGNNLDVEEIFSKSDKQIED